MSANPVNPLNWQVPIVNKDGTPTNEFMRKWAQQGVVNSDVGPPPLSNTHIFVGNAASVATDVALSGDGTISNTGALTVSKSGGVAFGSAAFVATTAFDAAGAATAAQAAAIAAAATHSDNASNLSSGTVPAARLPNPSATTLGGVESLAAVAHKFLTAISTAGVPSAAQPATTDLSDISSGAWTPTLSFGGSTTGITYANQLGNYFALGNFVVAFFQIDLTSKGSASGTAAIGGLPFNSQAAGVIRFYAPCFVTSLVTVTAPTFGQNVGGQNAMTLVNGDGSVTLAAANLSNTSVIRGFIMYAK